MEEKIISINPVEDYFSITWQLGLFCNYNCMYCSPEWHDTTSIPHSLETLKTTWTNIYNKSKDLNLKYKISFTGGEPTANKSFLPFLNWLRSNYDCIGQILITSNGSASLNYYKKLCQSVEALSLSTHSEYINEKEFFTKCKELDKIMKRPVKSLHVNIMNEFWNKERIKLYEEFLKENNISYSINKIDYSFKIRDFTLNKGIINIEQIL